jgi:hypothetical protein
LEFIGFPNTVVSHIQQRDWLYFFYIKDSSSAYTYHFNYRIYFEDGTVLSSKINYQFDFAGTVTAGVPAAYEGCAFQAEVGLKPYLAFVGQTLEQIEITNNSRLSHIEVWFGRTLGLSNEDLSERVKYVYPFNTRCNELLQCIYLTKYGNYESYPFAFTAINTIGADTLQYSTSNPYIGDSTGEDKELHNGTLRQSGTYNIKCTTGWVDPDTANQQIIRMIEGAEFWLMGDVAGYGQLPFTNAQLKTNSVSVNSREDLSSYIFEFTINI